jgi:serine/threonine-protein kinase
MEGTLIADRYCLDRHIGEGTTGEVWVALDLRDNRVVAIKRVKQQFAASAEMRSRLLREAQLAASISSPHVVRILDHGTTDDGRPFIAMEYLEGTSLRKRLDEQGSLSLDETLRLLAPLSVALEQAHSTGLVHRDLKPENVFLARVGEDESVKILDFGVAKAIDVAHPVAAGTITGDLRGTPCYMSPEQAQGLTTIDHRADLWAVGVIAFECITGVRPFDAKALGRLMAKILVDPIPVPSRVAPETFVAPAIDAWMARALARDPAARFGSARELAAAFAAAVQSGEGRAATGDESPIRRALEAGDTEAAVAAADKQLRGEVLRYLTESLGDADLAADAYADFLRRVWSGLPSFEWRSSFRTWAYVLARRAAVDLRRAEGRVKRGRRPLTDSRVAALAAHVRTETQPLMRTEGRSALARLRDELPHKDKMLFVLHVERGLSWREVAYVLLENDAPAPAELTREAARLRKRYQLAKTRLRKRAVETGLITAPPPR